jgi:hypothetical protein
MGTTPSGNRKIQISISRSRRETILVDWIEKSKTPKEMCINPLLCFHLIEALQDVKADKDEVEIAAIELIHILQGRIEIIEKLIDKKGRRSRKPRSAASVLPASEEEEEEPDAEDMELEINEEDFQ